MFASLATFALAVQPVAEPGQQEVRTVSVDGSVLAETCAGRDGWSDPAPPARIGPNSFYVGTCGISAILITSPRGHVLIDGATQAAAPQIIDNIRRLGFEPRDVRYMLSSHEHVDHAGGLAALKRATGARMVARAPARRALETGRADPGDPQSGSLTPFAGVRVDRVIADGETVSVGPIRLTAVATPGHTQGGTSWIWTDCLEGYCLQLAYVDSLSAVSADGYRFTDHPELVATFRRTFARVAVLPCQVLFTPHPGASGFFERMSGIAPKLQPAPCRAYAETAAQRLDERLAREGAAQ